MSVEVVTFGCRLNSYESAAMKQAAESAGHGASGDELIIVNSCAVTGEAVAQARQTIRRLHRDRPGARIVVTGCAAQTEPLTFGAMPEVAQVIGNGEKMRPESWRSIVQPPGLGIADSERIVVNDIMSVRDTALHLVEGFDGRTRAYVQVQTGCNHRCTFCIIPFGRGNARSVPMGEVVEHVRRLSDAGFREIVLTGVDMTSYGGDLPGEPRLGRLVKAILRHVPDVPRLRLSSIDSIEADHDLLDALAEEPRLMPHVHLSFQSGDDLILKRMKRRHSRAHAVAFCEQVRRLRPDVVFGADLIAGFPTEDEDMFQRSLALVDDCDLTHVHVFAYSARKGTPAARMPQVHGAIVRDRARRLREKGAAALTRHLVSQVGRRCTVLAERDGTGRTEGFARVRFANSPEAGTLVDARMTGHDGTCLMADQ
jgi:threonylcarbamoyladenosine tRNA methylthiotransferase MtaB